LERGIERKSCSVPPNFGRQHTEQAALYWRTEIVFLDRKLFQTAEYQSVDHRPQGFDKIVGKGKGIETVVVPDAYAGA
jgi:hypothetical protein